MHTTAPATAPTTPALPAIVLVPGHSLGAWAWDAVAGDLRERGHHILALTLPRLDPEDPQRTAATLAQQAEALRTAVREAAPHGTAVVVVAHSGAGIPASMVLDQVPGAVARVVYVDSGPSDDGAAFDASLAPEVDEVPLPPVERLADGASLDGLSTDDLYPFRERAVPMPGAVLRDLELVDLPTGHWPMWSRPADLAAAISAAART